MAEVKKSDNIVLFVLAALYTVLQAVSLVFFAIYEEYYGFDLVLTVQSALCAAVCFLLYFSYRSHNKNVMKPLIGAMLMLMLLNDMDAGLTYIEYFNELSDIYPDTKAYMVYCICAIDIFVASVLINIMHYVINLTHHSSPIKITVNKIFYALYIILVLGMTVSCFFFMESGNELLCYAFNPIPRLFRICMVIFIESKLDDFRILREAKAE